MGLVQDLFIYLFLTLSFESMAKWEAIDREFDAAETFVCPSPLDLIV